MSTYRGAPKAAQLSAYYAPIQAAAGFGVTWRRFVSATTGNQDVGQGDTWHYVERRATALFSSAINYEDRRPGGAVFGGGWHVLTPTEPSPRDEFVWRGETYNIEGEPLRSPVSTQWVTPVKRAE